MKTFSLFLLSLLVISSCSVNYEFDDLTANKPECIIVNGILTPTTHIHVRLHKLQKKDNQYSYTGLEGAKITFKEDLEVLYDEVCADSVFTLNHFPKAGAVYSIEVTYDGLKTVSAQTKVPSAIKCKCHFIEDPETCSIFRLSDFEIPGTENSCMWITSYEIYKDDTELQYNDLYTKHALVDKINSQYGMGYMGCEAVGTVYHNGFLRVRNKNLPLLDELIFQPAYIPDTITIPDSLSSYPEKAEIIKVKIITASPEYDQFSKSLYEQKYMIVYDEDITSIFFQPQWVYTNIENGLGIFAGMNEQNELYDYGTAKKD